MEIYKSGNIITVEIELSDLTEDKQKQLEEALDDEIIGPIAIQDFELEGG